VYTHNFEFFKVSFALLEYRGDDIWSSYSQNLNPYVLKWFCVASRAETMKFSSRFSNADPKTKSAEHHSLAFCGGLQVPLRAKGVGLLVTKAVRLPQLAFMVRSTFRGRGKKEEV